MSDMVLDQYLKLLDSLPDADPWPALEASGFLDILQPGSGSERLEDVFELAVATGRRPSAPPVIQTMVARAFRSDVSAVEDVEPIVGRPLAAASVACLMAGAMSEIQEMTIDYANTRKQFGREIGRFQAIQQQLAVMAEEVSAARIATQIAFSGAPRSVSEVRAGIAKSRCCQAAATVSAVAHAVHGAIGISEEFHLHRLTRKLRVWSFAHGGEGWWTGVLGAHVFNDERDIATQAQAV